MSTSLFLRLEEVAIEHIEVGRAPAEVAISSIARSDLTVVVVIEAGGIIEYPAVDVTADAQYPLFYLVLPSRTVGQVCRYW